MLKHAAIAFLLTIIFCSIAIGSDSTLAALTPEVKEDARQGIALYNQQKYTDAIPLLEKAAIHGQINSQYALAMIYNMGLGVKQNNKLAGQWFKACAEQNVAVCQAALSTLYATGNGHEYSLSEALFWSLVSTQNGYDSNTVSENLKQNLAPEKISPVEQRAYEWFNTHPKATHP